MSVTVETTEHRFHHVSETSGPLARKGTLDPEDRAVRCLVASQLAFCDATEPLREFVALDASSLPTAGPGESLETTTRTTLDEESTSSYRAIAEATLEFVEESVPLRTRIADAATPAQVVATLRRFGLDPVAARVDYLYQLQEEDPEEALMLLDSLREMAMFLVSERQLGRPQIGIDPDGLAQVEWRLGGDGVLAMEFLPSGRIRFAAVSRRVGRVSGTLAKHEVMDAVRPFTDHLESK